MSESFSQNNIGFGCGNRLDCHLISCWAPYPFCRMWKNELNAFFANFSCLSRVLLPLPSLYLTHWPLSSEYAICSLSKIDFSEPFSTRPPLSPSPPASNGFLKQNKMCIERGDRLETKSPLDVEVRYRPHFYSANTVNLAPLERVREGWYC